MTQQERIYRIVCLNPGITCTFVTRRLKTKPMLKGGPNRYYLKTTVLRELHRLCKKGKLFKTKTQSVFYKTVMCWQFYSYK